MLCMSLIVAVPVERAFVAQFFPASLTSGGNMIDFNHILIFELQLAPTAFSRLFLQELALDTAQEVVVAESLTPVQQISVIWACGSFHLDMSLDVRLRVIPQGGVLVRKRPAVAVIHVPIFVRYPAFAFVWVPKLCPSLELEKQDIFTMVEDFCCGHSAMVSGPSSNLRV